MGRGVRSVAGLSIVMQHRPPRRGRRPPRRGRRAAILTMNATQPSDVDHELVNRIAKRTGATPTIVVAVLLAALEEVPQGA